MKRLRLGLTVPLAETIVAAARRRALEPTESAIIRGTLASDPELPRELVGILFTRAMRGDFPFQALARVCLDVTVIMVLCACARARWRARRLGARPRRAPRTRPLPRPLLPPRAPRAADEQINKIMDSVWKTD